jgi:hypothetical protein
MRSPTLMRSPDPVCASAPRARRCFRNSRHHAVGSTQLNVPSTHDQAWRPLFWRISELCPTASPLAPTIRAASESARTRVEVDRSRTRPASALNAWLGGTPGTSVSQPSRSGQPWSTSNSGSRPPARAIANSAQQVGSIRLRRPATYGQPPSVFLDESSRASKSSHTRARSGRTAGALRAAEAEPAAGADWRDTSSFISAGGRYAFTARIRW